VGVKVEVDVFVGVGVFDDVAFSVAVGDGFVDGEAVVTTVDPEMMDGMFAG
jgi:hypothetical protein